MFKKIIFILPFFVLKAFSQKNKDLLPEHNTTFNLGLIAANIAHEYKLNERITLNGSIGLAGGFVAGSGSFNNNGQSYVEFNLKPTIGTSLRYYASLKNTNRKGKVNKLFSGIFFDVGISASTNSLGSPRFTDNRGGYGVGIGIGKQIQKNSGWNFSYGLGYNIYSNYFKGSPPKSPSGFGINFSIGYSLCYK